MTNDNSERIIRQNKQINDGLSIIIKQNDDISALLKHFKSSIDIFSLTFLITILFGLLK